jgi:hypothetical protein
MKAFSYACESKDVDPIIGVVLCCMQLHYRCCVFQHASFEAFANLLCDLQRLCVTVRGK